MQSPILAFIGQTEIIIIAIIILVLFGATRLPALGSGIGSFVKNLKRSMKEEEIDVTPEDKKKIDSDKAE